jgi:hypothetical protein
MRFLVKASLVAAGLFAIGALSSNVSANNAMSGTFTLSQPTEWKNNMLPAGNYTIHMARSDSDTSVLRVRGPKQAPSFNIMVPAQAACESCKSGALKLAMQGKTRAVTSMDLPGYHMDFQLGQPMGDRREMGKAPAASEQVAVHMDQN